MLKSLKTNPRSLFEASRNLFTTATSILFILICAINARWIFISRGLHDFGSFIAAGQLANQGENPYSPESPYIFFVEFQRINVSGLAPNLNPPFTIPLFQLFSAGDPDDVFNLWRIGIVILYFLSVGILLFIYKPDRISFSNKFLWCASLAGFWHTIQLGQLYTLLLLVAVGVFVFLERNKIFAAGILLGTLIAVKPNFVLWALTIGLVGGWQILLSAGATSIIMSLIPLFMYGPNIYQQWLEASIKFTPNLYLFPGNNSVTGLVAHFFPAQSGTVIGIIIAVVVFVTVYRKKPDLFTASHIGIVISLLISPIAWTGYTLFLLPYFLRKPNWTISDKVAALIFSIPFLFILAQFQLSYANFVFWGWFYGWGLLIILGILLKNLFYIHVINSKKTSF